MNYSSSWNGPTSLGDGPLGSAPTATTVTGQQDVFWRGTDNNLWETWDAGSWYGPSNLGYGNLASAPSVGSVYTSGAQYVFWKGSNGDLWEAWYSGSWNGPADLGMGTLGSAPAVAVDSSGNQYVFWQGTDGILREAWYSGGWHGPITPIGSSTIGSAPSAAIDGSQQQVYWAGSDGNLWEAWYAAGAWNGPSLVVTTGIQASMGTPPSAAAVGTSQVDVFWWGEGALWEAYYVNNIGWNGPISVFVDKCYISRGNDNQAYADGWSNYPGFRVGGIYSNVTNYSPWVDPQYLRYGVSNYVTALEVLYDANSHVWAMGWEEFWKGQRDTPIYYTDNYGDVLVKELPAEPVGSSTEYKILYENTPGQFTYFEDGVQVDHESDFQQKFEPIAALEDGEILTASSQMPGAKLSYQQFGNTHYWYPSGWVNFDGAPFNDNSQWFFNIKANSLLDSIGDNSCNT